MTLYDILRVTRYWQKFCCYATNAYDQNVPIGFGTRRELLDEEQNDELFDYLWKNSMNIQEDGRYQTRKPAHSSSVAKWRIGNIMANRGDVISVDKLWDIFDMEREKAWEGVDAPIGSPEWNAAAGKIDTINNICEAVNDMNTCSRSDGNKAKKPVWKVKQSVVHTDYADGTANTKTIQRASWCCPVCDWFVGEQVEIFGRKHNQQKKNFCDRCGQKIDWESVEKEAHP